MHTINCHPFQANFTCSYIWNESCSTMKNTGWRKVGNGSRKMTKISMKHSQLCLGHAKFPKMKVWNISSCQVSQSFWKWTGRQYSILLDKQHTSTQNQFYVICPLVSECYWKYLIYKAIPGFSKPSLSSSVKASAHRGMHTVILHDLLPLRWKPRFAWAFFVVGVKRKSEEVALTVLASFSLHGTQIQHCLGSLLCLKLKSLNMWRQQICSIHYLYQSAILGL